MTKFTSKQFKNALSQFATGVTVITTRLDNGQFWGIAANSFNSVSLNPPLVLWSLSDKATSLPIFSVNSHYVINILAANQTKLVEQFSQPSKNRFLGVEFTLSTNGLPILNGVAAWLECRNRSRYPEGDHVIFVGEVECCDFTPSAPLIFHGGQLLSLAN